MAGTTSGAKTLERGLGLLDHVAAGHTRLDDIAGVAGLSRSSAHRMLSSLVNLRFLTLDAEHRYGLGVKLLDLGNLAQASLNIPARLQAELEAVSARTSDTTHLGVLDGADIVYVAKARGHRGIEMASRPGARQRAQDTAMGKVLLAALPDDAVLAGFDATRIRTPHSCPDAESFLAAIEQTRARGYAVEDQESELGVSCVAVGVRNSTGQLVAAMSVSTQSVHMNADRIPSLVALLREASTAIAPLVPDRVTTLWD